MRIGDQFLLVTAVLGLLLGTGCGSPGAPQPPSLMLPVPITDLSATRAGGVVTLHWTTTRRTTDKVVLKADQRAEVCRAVGTGPCVHAGTILTAPNTGAEFDSALPPALQRGSLRLVRYEVRLVNHARRDAGSSNRAYAAAGAAPPAVERVDAKTTRAGIAVAWTTMAAPPPDPQARLIVRMVRERLLRPGESASPSKLETQAGVPQPLQQTLEALEHEPAAGETQWQPDHTLDAGAALNRRYRYTVQMIEQVVLDGHPLEVAGAPAQSAPLDATDIFPPDVPMDVAAVENQEGRAIDLSWSADANPDIAGYFVYRRLAEGNTGPERVSGTAPLAAPAWSDTHVKPGLRYAYSVSAVDTSGRESARSAETVEELRPAGPNAP